MNDKNTGGPAFPWCGDLNETPFINLGMTLRDFFAIKAMSIAYTHLGPNDEGWDGIAETAYMIADAMLRAREAA